MKKNLLNILTFILILFCWLLSGFIFKFNETYYSLLKLPSFTLDGKYISIIWFLIYILISISITLIIKKHNIFKEKDYFYILLTNYLSNQLFTFVFFYLMSPFLGFIITIIVFISSIFLYIETKKLNKKSAYFLIPYLIYNTYALFLMTSVYFLNF